MSKNLLLYSIPFLMTVFLTLIVFYVLSSVDTVKPFPIMYGYLEVVVISMLPFVLPILVSNYVCIHVLQISAKIVNISLLLYLMFVVLFFLTASIQLFINLNVRPSYSSSVDSTIAEF